MYDYFGHLADRLTNEQLIDVFGAIAALNEQPFCKDWVPLIAAVGPNGMLRLCNILGGKTVDFPPLYVVLVVTAGLMVLELEKEMPYEAAKKAVIGEVLLDGFDELVDKLRRISEDSSQVYESDIVQ